MAWLISTKSHLHFGEKLLNILTIMIGIIIIVIITTTTIIIIIIIIITIIITLFKSQGYLAKHKSSTNRPVSYSDVWPGSSMK